MARLPAALAVHILLSLLSLAATDSFGQSLHQTIRGTVFDAHSGYPIIGATVVLAESDPIVGAVTNAQGQFRLEDVDVGRHTLIVSYIGYEPASLPEILVGSGKEVVLEIPISESLLTFEEVVVTGEARKGMPQNEMVSVSGMSINVEELSRYAATFDDPARSVLSFPGVRGSGDDILNEIVVRGNSPRGVLWRIEGVDVPNPNHFAQTGSAGGGVSMLSNSMLRQSDFYTGAFPGAYGNALSGVFDIHLRNGNNEKREYAFEAGIIGIQAAAEGPWSSGSTGSYLVNYRYSALGLLNDIGLTIPGIIRFQDLSMKLQVPTTAAGQFTVWGLGGISAQSVDAEPENFDPYNENLSQKYGVGGLRHTINLGADTYLNSSVTGSYRDHSYVEDSLGLVNEETEELTNVTLRFASTINRKFSARHTAGIGGIVSLLDYDYLASYYINSLHTTVTELDDAGSMNMVQAFGQWQYRINEALTANTGVHYTRLGLNGSDAIEPRVGFRWSFQPGQVFTGAVGVHSRAEAPSIYLAQRMDDHGEYFQPNLELGLTRARHYVVGYENYLMPNVRFKTEVYYQDLFDVPVLDPALGDQDWMLAWSLVNATDGYTNLPLVSQGTGRNYGIEATVERFFADSYYLMATGSYFQSKYELRDGSEFNTRFNGSFIANVLGGKEIYVGSKRNNILSFNARVLWSGNNRQTPINVRISEEVGFTWLDWSRPYTVRLNNYFRMDLGFKYIRNTARATHVFSLSFQNVTGRLNEMNRYWSAGAGEIRSETQFGILPNFSYRIEF